jgi:uncharacterized protein
MQRIAVDSERLYYLDSSAFTKLFLSEPESDEIRTFFKAHFDSESLVVSFLTELETLRTLNRLDLDTGAAKELFSRLNVIPPIQANLELAAELKPTLLRSLDAIHLSCALSISDADVTMVTLDQRLAAAALDNGLAVRSSLEK